MRVFMRQSLWTVLLSLLSVVMVAAQGATCTGLLEDALVAVEGNCEGTGRNEVCYGFNQVSASFVTEVADDFFTTPSDLSGVETLETLQTAPLDVANDIWGVALMNIQADLPNSLPGQNVTFVLLGDVEIGNSVENAFEPSDGVEITVTSRTGANIRSGAGLNFNVIAGALPDETFIADGVSPDGEWFRIALEDSVAWINSVVVDNSVEGLGDLPTLTSDLQTPMQSFYLRTGIGQPECEDAPDDVLIVQGPENIEVNITVNGANIRIGSTVALRFVENEDGNVVMQVIAISGNIRVEGVRLYPGQVTTFDIQEDENGIPIVNGGPSLPQLLEGFGEEYCILESLPFSLLNYEIEILCPDEELALINSRQQQTATSSEVAGVDCSPFALVSPLGNVNSGNQTFDWTAVPADNIDYVVVLYNSDGIAVNEFRTSDTSLTVNLGSDTGTGGAFTWEVRAYQDTVNYACVTFRSPLLVRTGELNPPPQIDPDNPAFSAVLSSCTFPDGAQIQISWANAPTGSISISWSNYYGGGSDGASGVSGTYTSGLEFAGFENITVSSGGSSVGIGTCSDW